MKKILITGANSYIGVSLEQYLLHWPDRYAVTTLDVVGDGWKSADFSGYDALFHVAGIAHQKETAENRDLYYRVNRDLALEIAAKAKAEGIPHFVFMSSMSVYGMDQGVITPQTQPAPNSNYGCSKYEAEQGLEKLADANFAVAILRPPMVYGKNCRGNFQLMRKLVNISPVFPAINNRRSMISIRNLCAFVRTVIDRKDAGIFCPQNREYVNTTHMARLIAQNAGRKVWFSRLAGGAVRGMIPLVCVARKAFATLIYENFEKHDFCYCEENFEDSIRHSL